MKMLITKQIDRFIREERGQVLGVAIIMVLLGGMLIPPVLEFITDATNLTIMYKEKALDIYSADAGIEHAMWEVKYNDMEVFPAYDHFDYQNHSQYTLDEKINGLDVTVTMENTWIPQGIEVTAPAIVPPDSSLANHIIDNTALLSITGASEPVQNEFEIKIAADQAIAPNLQIERIGVWLPSTYAYRMESCTLDEDLWPDPDPEYYRNPLDSDQVIVMPFGGGGQIIIWDFTNNPSGSWTEMNSIDFDLLPGVNMADAKPECAITFKYDNLGGAPIGEPEFISWVDTTDDAPGGIPYTWDSDIKIYRISSRAGNAEIEAFISRKEEQMAGATQGKFIAVGNSSLLDGDGDTKNREIQLDESDGQIVQSLDPDTDSIPDNATITGARLYWSGWLDYALPNNPKAIIWEDDCKSFVDDPDEDDDNDWTAGSDWGTRADSDNDTFDGIFTAHHSGSTDECRYLYLNADIDLSKYVGEEVWIRWEQGEKGTLESDDTLKYAFSTKADNSWDWIDWRDNASWATAFSNDNPDRVEKVLLDQSYLDQHFRMAFRIDNFGGDGETCYVDDIYIYYLPERTIWEDDCTNGINSGTWTQTGSDWDQTTKPGTYTAQHICTASMFSTPFWDTCDDINFNWYQSGTDWGGNPPASPNTFKGHHGGGGIDVKFADDCSDINNGFWVHYNGWSDNGSNFRGYENDTLNGSERLEMSATADTSTCGELTLSFDYAVEGDCEDSDKLEYYFRDQWGNWDWQGYVFENAETLDNDHAYHNFTVTTSNPQYLYNGFRVRFDVEYFGGSDERACIDNFVIFCTGGDENDRYLTMNNGAVGDLSGCMNAQITWKQTLNGSDIDPGDCLEYELWDNLDSEWDYIGSQCITGAPTVNVTDICYLQNLRLRFRLAGFDESDDYCTIDDVKVICETCTNPVDDDRYLEMKPGMDLSGYPEVNLSWDQATDGALEGNDYLEYWLWDAAAGDWVLQENPFTAAPPPSNYQTVVNNPDYLQDFRVRFRINGFEAADEHCYIDNIRVIEQVITILADNTASLKITPVAGDPFWVYYDENGDPAKTTDPDEAGELVATTIEPERAAWMDAEGGYAYACNKDVTDLIQLYCNPETEETTFTIGDIDTQALSHGGHGDQYTYLGWALLLVYQSPDELGHRLIIYDDAEDLAWIPNATNAGKNNNVRTYDCSNFIVPEKISGEDNVATITVMVLEGDSNYDSSGCSSDHGDCLTLNGTELESRYCDDHGIPTYNTWDSRSEMCANEGLDIETFDVKWTDNLLAEGDTSATVKIWSGDPYDGVGVALIIMAFRSETGSSGALSYRIK